MLHSIAPPQTNFIFWLCTNVNTTYEKFRPMFLCKIVKNKYNCVSDAARTRKTWGMNTQVA
jgi:hypothetical protein